MPKSLKDIPGKHLSSMWVPRSPGFNEGTSICTEENCLLEALRLPPSYFQSERGMYPPLHFSRADAAAQLGSWLLGSPLTFSAMNPWRSHTQQGWSFLCPSHSQSRDILSYPHPGVSGQAAGSHLSYLLKDAHTSEARVS